MSATRSSVYRAVGQRTVRRDGPDKVTGAARYVADLSVPGLLHGAVLRSPFPHARIVRIDTSRAARLAGVRAVVTSANTTERPWGQIIPDQHVLAVGKVRYVGEEVAAVAATDLDRAREAIDLINVEYEELPAVFDPDDAIRDGAPLIHENKPGNVAMRLDVERGNVGEAFSRADLIVDDRFESFHQWPGYIEPMGTIADVDQAGRLTVWAPIQTIFWARARLAAVFGIPEDRVRVVQTFVGGGFGGKVLDDNNTLITAALALAARRPVRLINSREEDFLGGRPRVAMRVRVRMGFERSGRITAKEMWITGDNGAYSGRGPALMLTASLRPDTAYQYRDVKVQSRLVYTNKVPTGSVRGFGLPHASFAIEQVMDIAAHELGLDPADIARLNSACPGYVAPHGNTVTSCELKQCIDLTTQAFGWAARRARRTPGRGVGLACGAHVSGKRQVPDNDSSVATISIDEFGKATVFLGEGEIGQGQTTTFAVIAAEAIGLPVADVQVGQADTASSPFGYGAFGSRLTFIAGNAVERAAQAVRTILVETAAELLEAAADDVEIVHGLAAVRGSGEGSKRVTVREVARHHQYRRGGSPITGTGVFDPATSVPNKELRSNESGAYGFTCHAAEVEVDRETGQVRVLDYLASSDCGTVINPLGAEGQVEGAIVTGLGFALHEGFVFEDGRPLNPNFSDYKLPTIADVPKLGQRFAESYDPNGPYGAKGVGELGCDPVAPAIANAIFDAVGVRVTTLPITAEKVLAAIRAKEHSS